MSTQPQPKTEIVTTKPAPATPLARTEPGAADIMSVIAMLASNPNTDVDKIERLFAVKERYEAEERRKAFRAAKAKLCAELPRIAQNGAIRHGDKFISAYAKLDDMVEEIKPILAKYGFSLSFDSEPAPTNNMIVYTCELAHEAGHAETKRTPPVAADVSGAKNAIQAIGSSTTYARRILIKMHLNLVEGGEDDDGQAAGGPVVITDDHVAAIHKALADATQAGFGGFTEAAVLKSLRVKEWNEIQDRTFDNIMQRIRDKRAEAEKGAPR